MELSRNVNNRDMVNLRKLAACDEIFNNFINDLKNHEKNEAESLKKINDTIEGLLRSSGLKIDLANFQKLGSSEITVSLEKLAEKFEKALEKAKETGLSALVESIKETILRLRQLSETDLESNLMDDDNDLILSCTREQHLPCNCNEWGGDRLNEAGKWICEKCEETCTCPEDNWPMVPDLRRSYDHKITPRDYSRIPRARRIFEQEIPDKSKSLKNLVDTLIDHKPICQKHSKIPRSTRSLKTSKCNDDLSMVSDPPEGSPIDKNLVDKVARDHCPLHEASSTATNEACQCATTLKVNVTTDETLIKNIKDHSNAETYRSQSRDRGESKEMDNPTRLPATTIIPLEDQCDNEKSKSSIEENSMCACGCEDSVAIDCPCGCAEIVKFKAKETNREEKQKLSKNDCECTEPCTFCTCELFPRNAAKALENEERVDTTFESSSTDAEWPSEPENEMKNEDIEEIVKKLEGQIHSVIGKNAELKASIKRHYCGGDIEKLFALQSSQPPPIRATHSGLTTAIDILQSKCINKDSILAVLAKELRGSNYIDQIAKNLTAPCLKFTHWDFDQCGLYSYLKKPFSPKPMVWIKNKKSSLESKRKTKATNFHVIREICNYLLLSWNTLEDIRGISGYEIVVNGNFVAARVRHPMRTEAVIGPLNFFGSTESRKSIILSLYAVHSNGECTELASTRFP